MNGVSKSIASSSKNEMWKCVAETVNSYSLKESLLWYSATLAIIKILLKYWKEHIEDVP